MVDPLAAPKNYMPTRLMILPGAAKHVRSAASGIVLPDEGSKVPLILENIAGLLSVLLLGFISSGVYLFDTSAGPISILLF